MPLIAVGMLSILSLRSYLWALSILFVGIEDAISLEVRLESLLTVAILSLVCGHGWSGVSLWIALVVWILSFILHHYYPTAWGDGDGDMLFLLLGSIDLDQIRTFIHVTAWLILLTLIPLLLAKKVTRHTPVPLLFYLSLSFLWTIGG